MPLDNDLKGSQTVFLKISQKSQKNICAWVFFNKDSNWGPATLLQRDSGTGVSFFVNSAKFLKTLVLETSANGKIC